MNRCVVDECGLPKSEHEVKRYASLEGNRVEGKIRTVGVLGSVGKDLVNSRGAVACPFGDSNTDGIWERSEIPGIGPMHGHGRNNGVGYAWQPVDGYHISKPFDSVRAFIPRSEEHTSELQSQ